MQNIQLIPLLLFILLGLLGMWAHWLKKSRRGELAGTFRDYMLADYPGRSFSTIAVFAGMAFAAATTGSLDGLDLGQFAALIRQGQVHIPTINALAAGFMLGWMLDSGINKGV